MTWVIDACTAVEVLLRTPIGKTAVRLIKDDEVLAPALLDAEVLSAIRRMVLRARLSERIATHAINDLRDWPIQRIPHPPLLLLAWSYRHTVSAYDALYVATAKVYGASLLTVDGPLARAPVKGIEIKNLLDS